MLLSRSLAPSLSLSFSRANSESLSWDLKRQRAHATDQSVTRASSSFSAFFQDSCFRSLRRVNYILFHFFPEGFVYLDFGSRISYLINYVFIYFIVIHGNKTVLTYLVIEIQVNTFLLLTSDFVNYRVKIHLKIEAIIQIYNDVKIPS